MNDMRRKPDQEYSKALEVQKMHTPETSYQKLAKQNERSSIKPIVMVCGAILVGATLYFGGKYRGTEVTIENIGRLKNSQTQAKFAEFQNQMNQIRKEELVQIWEILNQLSDVSEESERRLEESEQRLNALQQEIIDDLTGIKRQQLEMNKSLNTLSAFRSNQRARAEATRAINALDIEEATF